MKCETHDIEMTDLGAADGIHAWFCERCEADCGNTCMAFVLIDGDQCPNCDSHNTERVDTIHDEQDFTVWIVACGACCETFELMVEHPVNTSIKENQNSQ